MAFKIRKNSAPNRSPRTCELVAAVPRQGEVRTRHGPVTLSKRKVQFENWNSAQLRRII